MKSLVYTRNGRKYRINDGNLEVLNGWWEPARLMGEEEASIRASIHRLYGLEIVREKEIFG